MARTIFALALALAASLAGTAHAQAKSEQSTDRPASWFVPLSDEPPAELFVDPPLAGALARGAAIIPYRTKHFRILPIFGAGATDVSPRAGHLHVNVDDLPWRWADAGNNGSVVVNGLPPGKHKILIELAMPDHRVIASQTVRFEVPVPPGARTSVLRNSGPDLPERQEEHASHYHGATGSDGAEQ